MPQKYQKAKISKKVQQQNHSNNCGEGSSKNTQKISKIANHSKKRQKDQKVPKKRFLKSQKRCLYTKKSPKIKFTKFQK